MGIQLQTDPVARIQTAMVNCSLLPCKTKKETVLPEVNPTNLRSRNPSQLTPFVSNSLEGSEIFGLDFPCLSNEGWTVSYLARL